MDERDDDAQFWQIPFEEDDELCEGIKYDPKEHVLKPVTIGTIYHLPGQPRVPLGNSSQVSTYCTEDLVTPGFEKTLKWLRYFPASSPILSLTAQRVHDRTLVITENPALHCILEDRRVFIKPLPPYLLSHAFWSFITDRQNSWLTDAQRKEVYMSASGFLHTYTKLIQHESDYIIALEKHLIQVMISFPDLTKFLRAFEELNAGSLNPRYSDEHELRSLNTFSILHSMKPYYRVRRYEYNSFFAPYITPMLFVFATFSVCLSAMQVTLQVRQQQAPLEGSAEGGLGGSWRAMGEAFRWFSIASLLFAGSMSVPLVIMFYGLVFWDSGERFKAVFRGRKKKQK